MYLPPKSKTVADLKNQPDRVYRTSIRPDLYLKLEQEAQERGGLTPYKLTTIIMTMYLEGRLEVVEDGPKYPKYADGE
jgi:hypothetical protein